MNPIKEKENNEQQEEHTETNPKEENKENEATNEPIKEGTEIKGDLLNLDHDNESSIEAKDKDEKKEDEEGEHDNKEEGKERHSFKSGEEDNNEEGEGEGQVEGEGEGEGEEGQISDLDQEVKLNQQRQKEVEKKTREKTFESVKLQYKYKLSLIERSDEFLKIYKKFWDLLPKTFEGDITQESFVCLFSKILKILLPLFNHGQIKKYCDGVWAKYVKGKPTMTLEIFEKVIFRLTHLISVHVNHYEYEDTLNLIYDRITCIRKYFD